MSQKKWNMLMRSPVGCMLTGISMFCLLIWAAGFNIYHASGGEIHSLAELKSCITEDEVLFVIIGTALLVFFLLAAKRAKRISTQEKEDEMTAKASRFKSANLVPYTMGYGTYEITYMVPDICTWDVDNDGEVDENLGIVSAPRFQIQDDGLVDCQYHVEREEDIASGEYFTAKEYIENQFGYLPKKQQNRSKIEYRIIEGREVYYFISRFIDGLTEMQRLYAVCDVKQGKMFEIDSYVISWKPELTIADFEGFFHFIL